MWLRSRDGTIILVYPGGSKVITKVLIREKQKDQSQRDRGKFEDVMMLALKMKEEAMNEAGKNMEWILP